MLSDPTLSILLVAMALVALTALLGRRRIAWAALGVLAAALLPLVVPSDGPPPPIELLGFAGNVLLVLLAFRLGRTARRAAPDVSSTLVVTLAVTLAMAGTALLSGVASLLSDAQQNAAFLLLVGGLMILPDGSVLATLPSDDRRSEGPRGLATLHGYMALFLLPALLFAAGRLPAASMSPETNGDDSAFWQLHVLGVLGALAAGGIGGGIGRIVRDRVAASRRQGLVDLFAATAPAGVAEWLHPGSGAIAALASGLTVSGSGALWQTHLTTADDRRGALDVAALAAAAGAFALGGLAISSAGPGPDWLGGLLLWISALGARFLLLVTVGGFYHCVRPGRLSWRWIVGGAWLSFPGTVSLAWVLSRMVVWPDASRGGDDPGSVSVLSLVFPALVFSLLVEAATAPFFSRQAVDADGSRGWQLVRGRRIALRAAEEALDLLAEQGELDNLSSMDREQLRANLERRRMLADIEMDELAHSQPRLRVLGQRAVLRELAGVSIRSLEEAARAGVIPRATVDALSGEIESWLKLDGAPIARPSPSEDPDDPEDAVGSIDAE
jgi:hypothetical protein